jgi:indole-3-glycerol phosphate synthase
LVEVHDERELERALATEAQLIGINNRNLDTLGVDAETSFRLRSRIPNGRLTISESGIDSPELTARLHRAGFQAILVGEALVRAEDQVALIRAFRGIADAGPASPLAAKSAAS